MPSTSSSVPACSWWPVIAVVLFSRMMNVRSWPSLIALEIATCAGVEERAVAHEHDLLVRDERVDAAARAAAEAHAAVVVHELFGRGEHQHRVAAGVAVGDEVDRGRCRGAWPCTRGRRSSCGARAAWRSCRGAGSRGRRSACAATICSTPITLSFGLLALRIMASSALSRPLRRCGGDLLGLLDERDEELREDRGVEAAASRGCRRRGPGRRRCGCRCAPARRSDAGGDRLRGNFLPNSRPDELGGLVVGQLAGKRRRGCSSRGSCGVPR